MSIGIFREFERNSNLFVKRYEIILLFIILIAAFFLRVLFLNVDSMWIDETISAVSAQGILEFGYPLLESGLVYERAEIFHYIMAFFIFVFGGDFGARFVSVVFGILTVFLAFVFAKKFTGKSFMALGFALVIALASIEVVYSRQARFYQFFQFLYFLSFYLFYRIVLLKEYFVFSKKFLSYSSLFLSVLILINTHLMGIVVPFLFVFIYIFWFFDFKSFRKLKSLSFFHVALYFIFFIVFLMFLFVVDRMVSFDNISRILYYSFSYLGFIADNIFIFMVASIGMIIALIEDFRKNVIVLFYVGVPFAGLFFVKYFATRYAYFVFFILFFYFVYAVSKMRFRAFVLIGLILLNLGVGFTLSPIVFPNFDSSMPIADYKGAFEFYESSEYSQFSLVTTWTPGAKWYLKENHKLYWIEYYVDGNHEQWMINHETGMERFANASVIDSVEKLPTDFVLVLDAQGTAKIDSFYYDFFDENCNLEYSSFNIEVFVCRSLLNYY